MLRDFEEIYAIAAARKGGERPLEELIARTALSTPALLATAMPSTPYTLMQTGQLPIE